MATLAEIKEQVFRYTNHLYTDQIMMRDLINNALSDLAGGAKLQKSIIYSVVPDQAAYSLPSGYKAPIALIEGTIDSPNYVYKLTDIGSAEYGYAIYDDQIWFKPTPNTEKDVTLYYFGYPSNLVDDTDVLEIDDRYANVLAAFAASTILSLPGMPEVNKYLLDTYQSMYQTGKLAFQSDMQTKQKQATVRKVNMW